MGHLWGRNIFVANRSRMLSRCRRNASADAQRIPTIRQSFSQRNALFLHEVEVGHTSHARRRHRRLVSHHERLTLGGDGPPVSAGPFVVFSVATGGRSASVRRRPPRARPRSAARGSPGGRFMRIALKTQTPVAQVARPTAMGVIKTSVPDGRTPFTRRSPIAQREEHRRSA